MGVSLNTITVKKFPALFYLTVIEPVAVFFFFFEIHPILCCTKIKTTSKIKTRPVIMFVIMFNIAYVP